MYRSALYAGTIKLKSGMLSLLPFHECPERLAGVAKYASREAEARELLYGGDVAAGAVGGPEGDAVLRGDAGVPEHALAVLPLPQPGRRADTPD